MNEIAIEAAELLDRAADRLTGHWCQRVYVVFNHFPTSVFESIREGVGWCAEGALMCEPVGQAKIVAWETLRGVIGERVLYRWNDAPGRTEAEVVDAFRRAAKQIREGR